MRPSCPADTLPTTANAKPAENAPARHPAFTLIQQTHLPLQNADAALYRHVSGAQFLSLSCADDNKVFGVNFRTPPADHTGLPHILEHSVLCGSERFPVKEPFKELLRTSLQTFLNAFTYPDRTCYPVASRNLRDFHNLMDVYLDAVFFPRLTPAVLGQEGWRVQWRPDGEIEFQGVVFNEMKGVYASADSRWEELVQRGLYEQTPYRFDYGGDPLHIPKLNFEQFQTFHQQHYHPANAFLYAYGDDDPAERLQRLDEVLSRVKAGPVPAPMPLQRPWSETKRHSGTYPAGEHGDEGIFVSLNWLLPGRCVDLQDMLLASMTGHLLFRNPASPLRMALLDSALGEDIIGGGVGLHLNQPHASFGLRGVEPGNERKVPALILEALQDIVRTGFRPDLIEGAFNTTEFYYREQNTGGTPKGLVTMLQALNPWINGGDPLETLQVQKRMSALRDEWREHPGIFQDWIRANLLENPARTEVIVRPDPDLARRESADEANQLAAILGDFTHNPQTEARARQLAADVEAFQSTPDSLEALRSLPHLSLADVREYPADPPLEIDEHHGRPLLTTPVDSSGILYANIVFDILDIPQSDLPLLSLYGRCLTELGTTRLDHVAFNEQIACHTGGLNVQIETSDTYAQNGSGPGMLGAFVLRVKCLKDKIPEMTKLIGEVLDNPRLGPPDRVMQMLLEEKANEEAGLIHNGSRVVSLRLNAAYSAAERASEEMGGLGYLDALRHWENQNAADLTERMKKLHRRVIRRQSMQMHLGGDPDVIEQARHHLQSLADAVPEGASAESACRDWSPLTHLQREGLVAPSPVNFVGLATRMAFDGGLPHGSATVVNRLLRNEYLWEQVRVRGGAYGASCSLDRITGTFNFTSYRDPHVLQTLEIYRNAGTWLKNHRQSEADLEQTKIGALGAMSRSRHAETAAYHSLYRHLIHYTPEMRQTQWEEVRATESHHVHDFGARLEEALARETRASILGARVQLKDRTLNLTLRDVTG